MVIKSSGFLAVASKRIEKEDAMTRNYFAELHPSVNLLYFASMIGFSMFFLHPVLTLVSLFGSLAYYAALHPRKLPRYLLKFVLPMLLLMSAANPLLNHAGNTILLYVNDNPFTLEACAYGVTAAVMFVGVLTWFSCSSVVLSADKIIYLFGRTVPSLSLVFSMVLRFVPRLKAQAKRIADAQKGVGKGMDRGGIITRAKNGLNILSILTTWALENGIITSDSMRARGFGLPGRSSFRIYSFSNRDKTISILLIVLISTVFLGCAAGVTGIRYFPSISVKPVTFFSVVAYSAYFLLCIFPIVVNKAFEVQYHGSF
jgi:energy-coupling factor transport system permease protein